MPPQPSCDRAPHHPVSVLRQAEPTGIMNVSLDPLTHRTSVLTGGQTLRRIYVHTEVRAFMACEALQPWPGNPGSTFLRVGTPPLRLLDVLVGKSRFLAHRICVLLAAFLCCVRWNHPPV